MYLELLKERELREPNKFLKCHFFNTFFYKKVSFCFYNSVSLILPPFHIRRLFSIAHIHIYVNESRHICVPRFNIYMNVAMLESLIT